MDLGYWDSFLNYCGWENFIKHFSKSSPKNRLNFLVSCYLVGLPKIKPDNAPSLNPVLLMNLCNFILKAFLMAPYRISKLLSKTDRRMWLNLSP